jgi:hypothetical protein
MKGCSLHVKSRDTLNRSMGSPQLSPQRCFLSRETYYQEGRKTLKVLETLVYLIARMISDDFSRKDCLGQGGLHGLWCYKRKASICGGFIDYGRPAAKMVMKERFASYDLYVNGPFTLHQPLSVFVMIILL